MIYLLLSAVAVTLFIGLHIACVRLKLMRFQLRPLIVISPMSVVFYLALVFAVRRWAPSAWTDPQTFMGTTLMLSSLVICISLCLIYMGECNMVEYESPSMRIMRFMDNQSSRRATYADLKSHFSNNDLILNRLDDLVAAGHIAYSEGHYRLLERGVLSAKLIGSYRALLRRGFGG